MRYIPKYLFDRYGNNSRRDASSLFFGVHSAASAADQYTPNKDVRGIFRGRADMKKKKRDSITAMSIASTQEDFSRAIIENNLQKMETYFLKATNSEEIRKESELVERTKATSMLERDKAKVTKIKIARTPVTTQRKIRKDDNVAPWKSSLSEM